RESRFLQSIKAGHAGCVLAEEHELAGGVGEQAVGHREAFIYRLSRPLAIRREECFERCLLGDLGVEQTRRPEAEHGSMAGCLLEQIGDLFGGLGEVRGDRKPCLPRPGARSVASQRQSDREPCRYGTGRTRTPSRMHRGLRSESAAPSGAPFNQCLECDATIYPPIHNAVDDRKVMPVHPVPRRMAFTLLTASRGTMPFSGHSPIEVRKGQGSWKNVSSEAPASPSLRWCSVETSSAGPPIGVDPSSCWIVSSRKASTPWTRRMSIRRGHPATKAAN